MITSKRKWFHIDAKADSSEPVEILIFDQIGKDWWSNDGVSAKQFAEEFGAIAKDRNINVRINSPGGNVWDGLAIYNLLNTRRDQVVTINDGIAASIASVIFLAGKRHQMPKNALLMIHQASGLAMGTAEEMDKMAEDLRKHDDVLLNIYREATGKSEEELRKAMAAETWFNGAEAKDYGFATELTDEVQLAASTGFDFTRFRNAPTALVQQPAVNNAAPAGKAEQKADTMKDTTVALLKKHGINPPENCTDEQAVDLISAKADEERAKRITDSLKVICATRPSLDFKACLPKAIADESILEIFRGVPEAGKTDYTRKAEDQGNPLIEQFDKLQPGAERRQFMLANHNDYRAARRQFAPQASNTLDSTLMTTYLADGVVTVVQNKLTMLKAFARDFSTDPVKPKAVVKVRKVTTGGSTQSNPSNFETGDTTISYTDITMAQINRSFHALNDEMNQGHRLAHIADWNAMSFSNGISDVVTALMTTANYGTAITVGAAASFTASDLASVLAAAKNYGSKNLLLDGGHLAYLLPTDKQSFRIGEAGAYGFDLISEQNRWTSATTNTCGFICDPNAIAIGAALPLELPSSEFMSLATVTVPGIGLSVLASTWFSRAGRVYWASFDAMFGAAACDTTAAELLITA